MADNLIFPIGFDLDKAVEQAKGEWSGVQKKMETMIASKPLRVPIVIEQSKALLDADGNIKAATGSIKAMRSEMASLIKRWDELSQSERLATDANGKFIGEAGQIVNRFAELTAASRTYARSLSELQSAADKAVAIQERSLQKQQAEDEKRYQQWLALKDKEVQQTEAAELKKENARRRAIAKQNETQRTREDARYDTYWKNAEKEAAKVEAAEAKKRAAYAASSSAQRQAAHEQAQAAFKIAQALKAQETSLDAINAKLQIYQQQIRGQQVGSAEWNKSALEIRRLTEELQKASQQMSDFQQKSFKGLSDRLTVGKVQALTQYRNELAKVEAEFNKLNQTGAAYDSKGGLTQAANNILKQRQDIIKNINQMLTTAADAQVQREKEINRIIEQRKAKADAIAAKRKAEQAAIQGNIAKLKEERRILNQQESSIANITAKLQIQQQRLQSAKLGSSEFTKTAKEVERLTKKLEDAKRKVDEVTGRVVSGARQQAAAHKQVTRELGSQSTYLDRLIKRMAVYWSVTQVGNFLTNVREVTAQFELQRVSLGAIIQDQQRANQLFEEIKTFALKSPVKILDLTKYTKQLAAYKIGVEDLFDTTKRLTDISVGLGVSMDRIVLMYGQIRATGYLRASEVRQATEAGIPLVEELAKKISKANGELTTAADVMDMISKRAISFDMVKEVFDDMTSAGGIFYNMQEKQGNTLYGMWQKLGDAAAMMYDQIGNTSIVNEGMKMTIQTLRYLMLHWKQVGTVVGGVTTAIAVNVIATRNAALASAAATAANGAHVVSLQRKIAALRLEQANLSATSVVQRISTAATISATQAQISAATATNMFSKALYGLKAMLLSNPLTALAVALTTIIALLMQSESELDKLNGKLQDIDRDYDASGKKSVDRFKELTKAVEENVDGSKAQKDALDELNRTYGKILGSEALELDSLKALGGQYGELINLIDAYNAKKRGEEKETAIKSSYATILDEEKDDLMDYLNQAGMSAEKQAEFISRLNEKMIEHAGEADAAIKATNETFQEFANDISQLDAAGNILNVLNFDKLADAWGVGFRQIGGWFGGQGMDYLYNYAHALEGQNKALDENEVATRNAVRGLDEYAGRMDNLTKAINTGKDAILDWSSQEALYNSLQKFNTQHPENAISIPIDLTFDPAKAETEYDKMLESSNMRIHAIFANLQSIASQEGITIPEEFYKQAKSVVEGNKDFSFIDFDGLAKLFTTDKAKNAVKESRLLYESIAPSDDTVRMFNRKFMTLADSMDVSLDKMQRYLMKSGDNLGEHRKRLSDEVTNLLKQIAKLEWTKKMLSMFGLPAAAVEEKIQESQQTLKLLQSMIADIPDIEAIGKKKKKKGDPRLGILQEMVSTLKQVNKEYDDLAKKEGSTKALKDTQKVYEATFKNMQKLAQQYKFKLPDFGVPTDTASLTKYLEAIKKAMAKLPKSQKAVLALQVDIDKLNIDEKQKQIEEELKRLADRISRTKTAQEFYDKILSTTGDIDLAASVTMSIYGDAGTDVQGQMAEYISQLFGGVELEVPVSIITSEGVIDYTALEKFATENKKILGDNYKELLKIAQDGQKNMAKTYEGYLKDLEVAKTYADKRIELARDTANKIAEIEKSKLPQAEKQRLTAGYTERESREAAKLEYEAFKDTPLYTQMFEDLDYASTSALTRMRDRLVALKDQWKNLDPTQLKELQKRLEEIDSQLAARNPFKALADAYKQWRDLRKSGRTKEGDELAADNAEKERKAAWDKMMADQKAYELAVKTHGEKSKEAQAAREAADASKEEYDNAENAANEAARQANDWKQISELIDKAAKSLKKYQQAFNDIAGGVRDIMEAFGASSEDMQFFDDMVGGFNKIMDAGEKAASAATNIMSSNPLMVAKGVGQGFSAIGGIVSGFTDLFSAGRVRKANKEIKRQQELLEQLQYTYSRLEYAADKAFGREYISNYQQQIKNLQAQQSAYLKQAQAERSKGKKEDKEKTKQFEEQARETADRIKEMQEELVAHFTGSSKTDIARQMAKSWIDARASMSDTFAAIKGDYADMIKNMIVEGAAARVIENALTPVWDSMEKMLEKNDVQGAIDSLVNGMDSALNAANNGMEVLWKALEARGYDMKKMLGTSDTEMTGIKREIATASEESITGLAAAINTQNYYISHVPQINENVAAIRALLETGGSVALPSGTATGWTDWQQQAMDNYNAIARNTAETVAECRRSAQACESIAAQFSRIIKVKGSITGINTFLNS